MTLKEAIESGLEFKQPSGSTWYSGGNSNFCFAISEILATDWITKPAEPRVFEDVISIRVEAGFFKVDVLDKPITLTELPAGHRVLSWEQVKSRLQESNRSIFYTENHFECIKKALGFTGEE